ncbi:3-oxoacyl-[acyl-carrier-protein] reductase [Magnetococcus marinus MC-1]|uniref:3-oxoacyl-[acyl-carrier-protein] reductase n=1 Tax=Magnetococcus marinus (strain ATCC BAA-1437 / JCM 17883 / MC-1) TaxID=156889 RepID=A0L6T4_MAGMM|nr:acetoacetyl-CoA reductase [Magnetococcus marinus]ABK43677.1 3-oxoacyl-[acyl-carrier-protein] reductase [Magnetococcus marinus MC-1]
MKDRVAMVSGGAGGIGTEIVRSLHAQGYKVASTCTVMECARVQQWKKERELEHVEVVMVEVDVRNYESCLKGVEEVESRLGPIDVLVNNAGITKDGVMKKMSPEQWQSVIDVNLTGTWNMTKAVLDGMLERQYGRIINISSVNGQKGQFGQVNYAAAKAGMHGITMSLAQEVARKGITVNTVSPGYIGTDMVMAIDEEIRNKIIATIPVGRLGKPEEIARLVTFLAAEESGFMTGADFSINGGMYTH